MADIASLKLKDYENNLIETDRRTNLINLKFKSTAFKILSPSIYDLYPGLINNKEFTVVTINELLDRFEEIDPVVDEDGTSHSKADLIKIINRDQTLSDETIADFTLDKLIEKNELVLFSTDSNLESDKDTTATKIQGMVKNAKTLLKEKGVYALYVALGTVEWTEAKGASSKNISPLSLIQIELKQDSKSKPFKLSLADEILHTNPFLAYKFEKDFGIELSNNDGGPLESYFENLSIDIEPLAKTYGIDYTIRDEAVVGIFNTSRINMYLDIRNNHDLILQNNNILKILGEPYDDKEEIGLDSELRSKINPILDLKNVVNADSSQLEAIIQSKLGNSFVLQGPPGTGKSQTITNIIAENIYMGKKVLFVSQKQAALEVVKNNLDQVGLSDFYLDLFDNTSSKETLEEINKLLDKSHKRPRKSQDTLRRKHDLIVKLDDYDEKLHSIAPDTDMSLYDYIGEYYRYAGVEDINFILDIPVKNKLDYQNKAVELISNYKGQAENLGYDYKKYPLYGYSIEDNSLTTRKQLREDTDQALEIFINAKGLANALGGRFNMQIKNMNQLVELVDVIQYLANYNILINLDNDTYTESDILTLRNLSDLAKDIKAYKAFIDANYSTEIYDIDIDNIYFNLSQVFSSKLKRIVNSREYKQNLYEVNKYSKNPDTSHNQVIDLLNKLKNYNQLLKDYESIEKDAEGLLGPDYSGIETDWERLSDNLSFHAEKLNKIEIIRFMENITLADFICICRDIVSNDNINLDAIPDQIKIINKMMSYFDDTQINYLAIDFDEAVFKLEAISESFDQLNNWINMRATLRELEDNHLLDFIDYLITQNIPLKDFVNIFQKAYYGQLIEDAINESDVLRGFSRQSHEYNIQKFEALDKNDFSENQKIIRKELYSKLPSRTMSSANSKYTWLRKENKKKRKLSSIREIMAEAGKEIQAIKPCFLVSPLNVSTFLDPETLSFDLVIFDEASQIFPWEAMGSIYRAKQAVIVGDSMQMPPSDYFRETVDEEDSFSEVNDYESILDICSGYLDQIRLLWHYRSKYEDLIAFSNKNFYDGNLITFPSTSPSTADEGVEFTYVDSRLDSVSKLNIKEAELVVDMIYDHFKNHPDRSLGVISLNTKQGELIENTLNNRRISENRYEKLFSEDRDEAFFIKNLETVQGDERDTIIFSIGYALNDKGVLSRQFGPLSRPGGERRLNVAASRAKINMKIVSSLHYFDIDTEGLVNEGASYLRTYLDFAENGTIALDRSIDVTSNDQFDSPFEEDVCEFLRSHGFTIDTQVGVSGYKIDMGLRMPATSKYLLAIECDGRTYHSSKNARDRDILRQEILESRGWNFYRIWSTDWFKNTEAEKEKLLELCNNLVNIELEKTITPDLEESNSNKDDSIQVQIDGMPDDIDNTEEDNISDIPIVTESDDSEDYVYENVEENIHTDSSSNSVDKLIDINDKTLTDSLDYSQKEDFNLLFDSLIADLAPINQDELVEKAVNIIGDQISEYAISYRFINRYLETRKNNVVIKQRVVYKLDS